MTSKTSIKPLSNSDIKCVESDIKNTISDTFRKEASRFNCLDFQPISSSKSSKPNKPEGHISEILLQAGLFPLIGGDASPESYQWIFYNGQLLSSPSASALVSASTSASVSASDSMFSSQYQNEHLSLKISSPQLNFNAPVIYLIHIYHSTDTPYCASPKISILAEENAQATILECYVTLGSHPSFVQANTKIILKKQAKIDHCIFTQHLNPGPQISQVNIQQDSQSEYQGLLMTISPALYKANILIELLGHEANSEFNILMSPKESEYSKIELSMHHAVANCQSRTMTRTVLKDQAFLDFTGKIMVDKNAEATDAALDNKNLLLSPMAKVNTEPQLEIYNGNIQCKHGATVGQLDEDALFYLQSRGIARSEAIQILIEAFLQPIINRISHQALKAFIEKQIHDC